MALSQESLSYLIDGMGATDAGNELITAIQSSLTLSAASLNRLKTAFGEDGVATNFQNAILGNYVLTSRDRRFVKDGFSLPISALASVFDNIQNVAPTFSVAAGAYGPSQSVSLASLTPKASIFYTTNGATPTSASTLFVAGTPITVSSTETLKAITITSGTHNSVVSSAAYTINGAVATPTASPVAGSYGPTQTVTLSSATSGAALHFSVDGSTPTSASTLYTAPISVSTSQTVKVLGVKAAFSDSAIASIAYTINGAVATASFSPIAGSYSGTQTVTISSATSGATFYYTVDNSTPTTGSTLYTAPISVDSSETIKVLGVKAGFSNSAIGSAAYVIS